MPTCVPLAVFAIASAPNRRSVARPALEAPSSATSTQFPNNPVRDAPRHATNLALLERLDHAVPTPVRTRRWRH